MKPRTKIEKRVCELSSRVRLNSRLMKKITDAASTNGWSWMPRASLMRKDRDNAWCHNCGGTFHVEIEHPCSLVNIISDQYMHYPSIRCPHCGQPLSGSHRKDAPVSGSRRDSHYTYIALGEVQEEFQVVRYFQLCLCAELGKPIAKGMPVEVVRRWYDKDGHDLVESVGLSCFGYVYHYNLNNALQLRREGVGAYSQERNYAIYDPIVMGYSKWADWLTRDGFSLAALEEHHCQLFDLWMFAHPHRVTMMKAGYWLLNNALSNAELKKLWYAVKICMRHKYQLTEKNIITYKDYLLMAHEVRIDLHNPVLACPANLKEAHDRLVVRRRKMMEEQRRQRELAEMAQKEKAYSAHILPFIGLCLEDGNVIITPLESVKAVWDEADYMGHCVYTAGYYKKTDVLLLSARDSQTKKRLETIELSLKDGAVLQSRARFNKTSDEHGHILAMMSAASQNILRMARKRKQQKV